MTKYQSTDGASVIVDDNFLDGIATTPGGWTKEQLAILGVPWPPAKGWKAKVVGTSLTAETARYLMVLGRKKPALAEAANKRQPDERAARREQVQRERQEALLSATDMEADVRYEAERRGVRLTVAQVRCGRTTIQHWTFRTETGQKLLDYWPSSGAVWFPASNDKDRADDPWQALGMAADALLLHRARQALTARAPSKA